MSDEQIKKVSLSTIVRSNTFDKIFDTIDYNFKKLADVINSGSLNASIEIEDFIARAGQVDFSTKYNFLPGTNSLEVFRNNARQWEGSGYEEVENNSIRLVAPCELGDQIKIRYVRVDPDYITVTNLYEHPQVDSDGSVAGTTTPLVNNANTTYISATDIAKVNEAIRQISSMMIEVQSFVHGGTGSRRGEATDNATYLYNECKRILREIKNIQIESGSTSASEGLAVTQLSSNLIYYKEKTVNDALEGIELTLQSLQNLIKSVSASEILYRGSTVEVKLDNLSNLMKEFDTKLASTALPSDIELQLTTINNAISRLNKAINESISASAVFNSSGESVSDLLDELSRNVSSLNSKITRETTNLSDDIDTTNKTIDRLSRSINSLSDEIEVNESSISKLSKTVSDLLTTTQSLKIKPEDILIGKQTLTDKLADVDASLSKVTTDISTNSTDLNSLTRRVNNITDNSEQVQESLVALDRKTTKSINSLSTDVESYFESVDLLDTKLTKHIANSTADLTELYNNNSSINQQLQSVTTRLTTLESKDSSSETFILLSSQVQLSEKNKNTLDIKLQELDDSITTLVSSVEQISPMRLQLTDIDNRLISLTNTSASSISELDRRLTKNISALETRADEIIESVDSLSRKTTRLINGINTDITELLTNDSDKANKISSLTARVAALEETKNEIVEQQSTIELPLLATQVKLSSTVKTLDEKVIDIDSKFESLSEFDNQQTVINNNVTLKLASLEATDTLISDSIASIDRKYAKLTSTLSNDVDEYLETLDQIDRKHTRSINSLNNNFDDLTITVANLTARYDISNNKFVTFEQQTNAQLTSQSNDIARLLTTTNNIKDYSAQFTEIDTKLTTLNEAISALSAENVRVSARVTVLEDNSTLLANNVTDLTNTVTRNHSILIDSIANLNDSTNSSIAKLTRSISSISDELTELSSGYRVFKTSTNTTLNDVYSKLAALSNTIVVSEDDNGQQVTFSGTVDASSVSYRNTNVMLQLDEITDNCTLLNNKVDRNNSTLTSTTSTLTDSVSLLTSKTNRLSETVLINANDIDKLSNDVVTAKNKITTLTSAVSSNTTLIDDLTLNFNNNIRSINNRLSALESNVPSESISPSGGNDSINSGTAFTGTINATKVIYSDLLTAKDKFDELDSQLTLLSNNQTTNTNRVNNSIITLEEDLESLRTRTSNQHLTTNNRIDDVENSLITVKSTVRNQLSEQNDSIASFQNTIDEFAEVLESSVGVSLTGGNNSNSEIKQQLGIVEQKIDSLSATTQEIGTQVIDIKARLQDLKLTNDQILEYIIPSNAANHNSIYRGNDLGTEITTDQLTAIESGTFENIYVGDSWNINGTTYRVVGLDTFLNTGPESADDIIDSEEIVDDFNILTQFDVPNSFKLTKHHVIVVPDDVIAYGTPNLHTESFNDSLLPNPTISPDTSQGGSITSPSGEDTVTSPGGGGDITIIGGDDTITTPSGDDTVTTPSGEDTITIPSGDDTITVTTPSGDDTLTIPSGEDTVTTPSGDITIIGGDDTITTPSGDDTVTTPSGEDTITVTTPSGDDTLTIPSGDDTVTIIGGDDTITTLSGDDTVTTPSSDDTLTIPSGDDTVTIPSGDITIIGGDDTVTTPSGDNTITTPSGDDTVTVPSENETVIVTYADIEPEDTVVPDTTPAEKPVNIVSNESLKPVEQPEISFDSVTGNESTIPVDSLIRDNDIFNNYAVMVDSSGNIATKAVVNMTNEAVINKSPAVFVQYVTIGEVLDDQQDKTLLRTIYYTYSKLHDGRTSYTFSSNKLSTNYSIFAYYMSDKSSIKYLYLVKDIDNALTIDQGYSIISKLLQSNFVDDIDSTDSDKLSVLLDRIEDYSFIIDSKGNVVSQIDEEILINESAKVPTVFVSYDSASEADMENKDLVLTIYYKKLSIGNGKEQYTFSTYQKDSNYELYAYYYRDDFDESLFYLFVDASNDNVSLIENQGFSVVSRLLSDAADYYGDTDIELSGYQVVIDKTGNVIGNEFSDRMTTSSETLDNSDDLVGKPVFLNYTVIDSLSQDTVDLNLIATIYYISELDKETNEIIYTFASKEYTSDYKIFAYFFENITTSVRSLYVVNNDDKTLMSQGLSVVSKLVSMNIISKLSLKLEALSKEEESAKQRISSNLSELMNLQVSVIVNEIAKKLDGFKIVIENNTISNKVASSETVEASSAIMVTQQSTTDLDLKDKTLLAVIYYTTVTTDTAIEYSFSTIQQDNNYLEYAYYLQDNVNDNKYLYLIEDSKMPLSSDQGLSIIGQLLLAEESSSDSIASSDSVVALADEEPAYKGQIITYKETKVIEGTSAFNKKNAKMGTKRFSGSDNVTITTDIDVTVSNIIEGDSGTLIEGVSTEYVTLIGSDSFNRTSKFNAKKFSGIDSVSNVNKIERSIFQSIEPVDNTNASDFNVSDSINVTLSNETSSSLNVTDSTLDTLVKDVNYYYNADVPQIVYTRLPDETITISTVYDQGLYYYNDKAAYGVNYFSGKHTNNVVGSVVEVIPGSLKAEVIYPENYKPSIEGSDTAQGSDDTVVGDDTVPNYTVIADTSTGGNVTLFPATSPIAFDTSDGKYNIKLFDGKGPAYPYTSPDDTTSSDTQSPDTSTGGQGSVPATDTVSQIIEKEVSSIVASDSDRGLSYLSGNALFSSNKYFSGKHHDDVIATSGSITIGTEVSTVIVDTVTGETVSTATETVAPVDTVTVDTTIRIASSGRFNGGIFDSFRFDTKPDESNIIFAVDQFSNAAVEKYMDDLGSKLIPFYTRITVIENNAEVSKWVKVKYRNLTEIAIFGTRINSKPERTEITTQFPLFKMYPSKINIGKDYWLSDTCNTDSESVCYVTSSGEAYYDKRNKTKGIRPFYIIGS